MRNWRSANLEAEDDRDRFAPDQSPYLRQAASSRRGPGAAGGPQRV